jgi:hypothetical protein
MEKVASKKKALARAKQLMVMEKSDASLEFAINKTGIVGLVIASKTTNVG